MAERVKPDSPSTPFLAGTYVFTRFEAIVLARLHKAGHCLYRLKSFYHPTATLQEVAVAINIGSLIDWDFYNIDELHAINPSMFDPDLVCLELSQVGEAHQGHKDNE